LVVTAPEQQIMLALFNTTGRILIMRVFWHEGGLHIHPESEHEGRMLVEIVDRLKFEKPPEMQVSNSSGSSLSCDDLVGSLIGNHEVVPMGLTAQTDDKKPVIRINERR
jgi:hypothetical protein